MIIGIVAVAQNFAIGKNGKLPWHYSADLNFFKKTTLGNVVVMGRKTFDSIGKPLPNRLNIVLSRNCKIENPLTITLKAKETVLELEKYLGRDVYIIGGAGVYREFAELIEKWIVTEIPLTIDGADAFMPTDFLAGFKLSEKIRLDNDLSVKSYARAK